MCHILSETALITALARMDSSEKQYRPYAFIPKQRTIESLAMLDGLRQTEHMVTGSTPWYGHDS